MTEWPAFPKPLLTMVEKDLLTEAPVEFAVLASLAEGLRGRTYRSKPSYWGEREEGMLKASQGRKSQEAARATSQVSWRVMESYTWGEGPSPYTTGKTSATGYRPRGGLGLSTPVLSSGKKSGEMIKTKVLSPLDYTPGLEVTEPVWTLGETNQSVHDPQVLSLFDLFNNESFVNKSATVVNKDVSDSSWNEPSEKSQGAVGENLHNNPEKNKKFTSRDNQCFWMWFIKNSYK